MTFPQQIIVLTHYKDRHFTLVTGSEGYALEEFLESKRKGLLTWGWATIEEITHMTPAAK